MEQHKTTGGIRINEEMVNKIRQIAKSKGQMISGYIEVNLSKSVERDWKKLQEKQNGLQPSKN